MMRDSGRQIGDCKHGNIRETCRECVWEYAMTHRDTRPRYRIKRLEWFDADYPEGGVVAYTSLGYFYVFDGNVWTCRPSRTIRKCTDLEDGKRVAQEWFDELMREGLEAV